MGYFSNSPGVTILMVAPRNLWGMTTPIRTMSYWARLNPRKVFRRIIVGNDGDTF